MYKNSVTTEIVECGTQESADHLKEGAQLRKGVGAKQKKIINL